jgi:hypothetical protein
MQFSRDTDRSSTAVQFGHGGRATQRQRGTCQTQRHREQTATTVSGSGASGGTASGPALRRRNASAARLSTRLPSRARLHPSRSGQRTPRHCSCSRLQPPRLLLPRSSRASVTSTILSLPRMSVLSSIPSPGLAHHRHMPEGVPPQGARGDLDWGPVSGWLGRWRARLAAVVTLRTRLQAGRAGIWMECSHACQTLRPGGPRGRVRLDVWCGWLGGEPVAE